MSSRAALRRDRARRMWRGASPTTRRLVWAGAAVTGAFAVLAVAAPAVAPYGQSAFGNPQLDPPSLDHLFGTSNLRYDVLSRVVFGARLAFEVVLLSTVFAIFIGVPLGLAAGYRGGRADKALVLVMDALYAFPALLLAIVMAFALRRWVGPGVPAAALSISVIYVPQYFRVVRNHTLSVREEPFVDAARAMGAPPRVVITRYVLANVIQSVPVIFTVNAADAVLTLAGLGFLGYGVGPRTAEWGQDIARAISDAGNGFYWTALFPGLAILTLVTALTLLGEGINDVLNPRLRAAGIDAGPEPAAPEPISDRLVEPPPPETVTDRGWGRKVEVRDAVVRAPVAGLSAVGPAALAVEGLRVTYRRGRRRVTAVDGVSLRLAAGESLGLVGESGCGKTTLGRAVLGLLPPGTETEGAIALDGTDLTADPGAWRRARGEQVSMVFQEPATRLDPLQRIEAAFTETIRAHRPELSRAQARQMAAESLASVGVPPGRIRQHPHEFSGGMRQRIMIALAVVLGPRVLIADEPTTALDVLVEAQILDLLDDLRRDLDMGLLLVTHNLAIVAQTCDRVAVMYAGKLIEQGPVGVVFAQPLHPYTQGLLASVISLDSTALSSIAGVPPDLAAPPPGCRFADRCPLVMEICRLAVPAETGDGHTVACHLYGPGAS